MSHLEISAREFRAATIDRATVNVDERTVELSFSSEHPVARWWGIEVLGHHAGEMDESWIGSGRAPMLVDHKATVDQQVGVIEKAWIADGKGRARARFGKGARASEIFERVQDGELSSVSVGYEILEAKLVSEKEGVGTYRATSWKPLEVSFVAVPADPNVGVGRARTGEIRSIPLQGEKSMRNENTPPVAEPAATHSAQVPAPSPVAPIVDPAKILADERSRVSQIEAIGAKFNCRDKATKAIADGTGVDVFRGIVLDSLGAQRAQDVLSSAQRIGMTEKEVKQFSFLRAINALANPTNAALQAAAGFEHEVSQEAAKRAGRASRGIMIPVDVLREKRDLTVGTAADGGYLKATNLLSGSFIEMLRNRMMVRNLGATVLMDLVGDIAIPRQTGGATAYWVPESGAPTETKQAFDQVPLAPKSVGAFTDISRKLLLQSSIDIEQFVRNDLATILALEIDRAAIHGSGASNQPTGIVATSGIGSVAGGTNGAAPTFANVVALETAVSVANADIGTLAYLTNAKVRGKLKTTEKAPSATVGNFVWGNGNEPGYGELNGYRAAVSNQVSAALTKGTSAGVCSAIIYGNWADLLIGMWSGLDLTVDPYTGATSGTVRVVALQDVDVAVRHAESFSAMLDALTT